VVETKSFGAIANVIDREETKDCAEKYDEDGALHFFLW
jgi:hypothetical protein